MRNYDKYSKGSPRCILKIDIMKVFDSIDWSFVLNVMKALDIPSIFINWFEVCITMPWFLVKIIGFSEGFITAKRGLRQGNPIGLS